MKKSIYSEKQRKLCAFLKQARLAADLTQQDLAKKVGKPQSFVAKYEIGERRLDVIELLEIIEMLDISVKDALKAIAV